MSVWEIKDRVEKLEAVAQTVTISVPYISQDQYLGYPEDSGFTQLLAVQLSEAQPDTIAFQDSEASSIMGSDFSDLLNSSRDMLPSSLPIPKMPETSLGPKKRGQPAPKELHQEKPIIQETPDNPPEDLHPRDRGHKR